jgi:hypothetical protein
MSSPLSTARSAHTEAARPSTSLASRTGSPVVAVRPLPVVRALLSRRRLRPVSPYNGHRSTSCPRRRNPRCRRSANGGAGLFQVPRQCQLALASNMGRRPPAVPHGPASNVRLALDSGRPLPGDGILSPLVSGRRLQSPPAPCCGKRPSRRSGATRPPTVITRRSPYRSVCGAHWPA